MDRSARLGRWALTAVGAALFVGAGVVAVVDGAFPATGPGDVALALALAAAVTVAGLVLRRRGATHVLHVAAWAVGGVVIVLLVAAL